MSRIAILQHRRQKVNDMLLIHSMAKYWRRKGLTVDFYNGLSGKIEADILIPQIDLTITPPEYVKAISSFEGIVLNRGIYDISKSKISSNLVQSDYEGAVIVKPNLNSNGDPELRLKSKIGKGIHLLKEQFGLIQKGYQIYTSIQEVPRVYKVSKRFVIEKFLPERDGEDYIVHLTTFLGDLHKTIRISSKESVIKGHTKSIRIPVPTPEVVIDVKNRMGFDYGKFDFTFYNDELVLLDANNTPGGAKPELIDPFVRSLESGIDYYTNRL